MGTIGIGVRVWIGWAPKDLCIGRGPDTRLHAGTIIDGPFERGDILLSDGNRNALRMWRVKPDEQGLIFASEDVLSPIDDGLETEAERENKLVLS